MEIAAVTSRQEGSRTIAMIHPSLTGRLDLRLEDLGPAEVAARAECVFSCLPHGGPATLVPHLLDAGCRVVDFSADYRLNDAEVYAQWYGQKHADPERLGQGGLRPAGAVPRADSRRRSWWPIRAAIRRRRSWPLAPLLKAGADRADATIIVDSKSGVSGAGRTPKLTTHYPECNESISAYNVGRHRHTPEIEQVLSTAAGRRSR